MTENAATAQPLLVDARGLRCPWPALRLARAMRGGAASVRLLSDDPKVAGEVAALAAVHGWAVSAEAAAHGHAIFRVGRADLAGSAPRA